MAGRISKRVQRLVAARQHDRCETCDKNSAEVKARAVAEGASYKALMEFDHINARALGGDDEEGNVQMLCHFCHLEKTTKQDMPKIVKAKRLADKAAGERKSRNPLDWRKAKEEPVHKLDRIGEQPVV